MHAMLTIAGRAEVDIKDEELETVNSKFLDYEGEFQKPDSLTIDKIGEWFDGLVKQKETLAAGQISYEMVPINLYIKEVDILIHSIGQDYITQIKSAQEKMTQTLQKYNQADYINFGALAAVCSSVFQE